MGQGRREVNFYFISIKDNHSLIVIKVSLMVWPQKLTRQWTSSLLINSDLEDFPLLSQSSPFNKHQKNMFKSNLCFNLVV